MATTLTKNQLHHPKMKHVHLNKTLKTKQLHRQHHHRHRHQQLQPSQKQKMTSMLDLMTSWRVATRQTTRPTRHMWVDRRRVTGHRFLGFESLAVEVAAVMTEAQEADININININRIIVTIITITSSSDPTTDTATVAVAETEAATEVANDTGRRKETVGSRRRLLHRLPPSDRPVARVRTATKSRVRFNSSNVHI